MSATRVTVTIAGRLYVVEIEDLGARPVVARVDGERFDVWPGALPAGAPPAGALPAEAVAPVAPAAAEGHPPAAALSPAPAMPGSAAPAPAGAIHAPIPGVVLSIAIEPGAEVAPGQELCVIEAMKMKNTIRAARAGRIARVLVAPGQTVRHHDLLAEYAADGDSGTEPDGGGPGAAGRES
jgi:biotin carboxyl carrier protein